MLMNTTTLRKDYQFKSSKEAIEFVNKFASTTEPEPIASEITIKNGKVTLIFTETINQFPAHQGGANKRGYSVEVLNSFSLTICEIKVLQLISDGFTNEEISARLFTSKRTTETHRASLLKKMGAKNTAILIKLAVQNGLVK